MNPPDDVGTAFLPVPGGRFSRRNWLKTMNRPGLYAAMQNRYFRWYTLAIYERSGLEWNVSTQGDHHGRA